MKHPSSAPCPEMAAGVRESVPAAAPYHAGPPAVALAGGTPAIRRHARAGDTGRPPCRSEDPAATMRTSHAIEYCSHLSRWWPGRNPNGAHGLLHRQSSGRSSLIGSRGGCHRRKSWCCAVTRRAMPGDGCHDSSAERDCSGTRHPRGRSFDQGCECASCSRGSTGLKRRRPTLSMLTPSTRSSRVAPSRRGEWISPSW